MASSSSRVPGGSASKPAAKAGTSATNRSGARSSERAAGGVSNVGTTVSSALNPSKTSQKGKAWIVTPLSPIAPPTNPAESQNGLGEGPVSSRLRRVPGRPLSKTAYAVPSSSPPPASGRSSSHSESANSPERKRGRYADSPRRGPSSFLRPPKKEQSPVGATGSAPNSESPTLRRSYRGKHRVNDEEAEEPPARHPKKRFSISNPETNVQNRPTRRSSQKSPEVSSTIASPVKVKEEPGSDSSTDSEPIPTNKEKTNTQGKTKSSPKPASSQNSNCSSAKSLIPPPRVSSRTKPGTTGSCASRSRRASRAGFASLPSDQRGMSGQEAVPGPSHASSTNPGPSANSASGNNQSGTAASGGAAAAVGLVSEAFGGSGEGGGAVAGSVLLGGGAASNALGMSGDSESDDNEMGRLQALLEARGLPPHLFGALGPRMQHFLHRSMGSSTTSKAHQLLVGLQCTGDEGQQLQAVIEMCQLLVMGNEDTLAGFPVKQVVPALITLLHMEHNFDIMNHACRALTYMMEALPRSSAVVVDAIPAFLEKLQVIQCMDVAEQSLTALEMLSRRHSKSILQARGVAACLMYLDFFSVNAQRAALSITANCCQNLHADEFHYVEESLGLLAGRLTQHDKKSVESVCLAFSRLVDGFQSDLRRLQEIASTELLANLQQLLVVSPPIMSTGTFIMVVRMMSIMCAHCPELAVKLLKQNISHTLCYLLTGPSGEGATADAVSFACARLGRFHVPCQVELVSRSPQELYEITSLIGELMPRLPTEGLFGVDALLLKPSVAHLDGVLWQWRDDRGLWHPYSAIDSRIVEAAHQSGEDEISLSTMGRTYTLDFHSMQQINDETGTTRPVQRKVNHTGGVCQAAGSGVGGGAGTIGVGHTDSRVECLRGDADLANNFIRSLFSVLYEVYSSSAGPAVRHKCLRAVLRMLYYASPELLQDVLKNQQVSSHLAGMLSSQDLKIVVGALQMAHILMSKLPEVFGVQFRREGVVYQVQRLADPNTVLGTSTNSSSHLSGVTGPSVASVSGVVQDGPGPSHMAMAAALNGHMSAVMLNSDSGMENAEEMEDQSSQAAAAPPSQSFGDVLKRKRGGKKNSGSSGRKTRPEGQPEPGKISPSLDSGKEKDGVKVKHSLSGSVGGLNGSKTSSFLASLNPARWGRSHTAPSTPPSAALPDRVYKSESCPLPKMLSNPHLAGNREKVKTWIREQAAAFLATYFSNETRRMSGTGTDAEGALHSLERSDGTVLERLTATVRRLQANPGIEVLEEIREIVLHTDISSFEVIHSGLVPSLTAYLADEGSSPADREQRNRTFLHVYLGCPLDPLSLESPKMASPVPLQPLVAKLNACVNQLEQFPVRVHDLPGSAPGGGAMRSGVSALKFFYTHQLKCNLQRHPNCTTLKQWKGGAVKIDPLALVQAIEKYLVIRGYGRLRDKDAGDSDDDNSEEDIDDTLAAVMMNQGTMRHKLQFLINEHVIPYNMTVYEAVRQFGMGPHFEQSETDTDNEAPVGSASIWVHTHNIYYRPVPEYGASNNASTSAGGVLSCSGGIGGAMGASLVASSSRKGKGGAKPSSKKKGDELWNEGLAPEAISPLVAFWSRILPESVSVEDPSLPLLNLLRILHALNRHWSSLYVALPHQDLLPPQEYISAKITAKANRQLQDPLVIMTGNLPAWLQQVTLACPFLFPLDTRQLLFYATSFDRDRALQRLVDSVPELSHGDSQERVTPRLDRRKRTVSREDILKQAEQVLQDLGSSRALLEIQYENEVGTGLGPTLEFYALVSRELQRADLDLWRGAALQDYIHHSAGLFPAPLPRNLKVAQLTRVRSKFRFLGKFVAKAIMDSRMLDLPFSLAMYRWLLGHEQEFTGADLRHVDPDLYRTYLSLCQVLAQKKRLEATSSLSLSERQEKIANLTLDGCSIEDLGLDFTVPGMSQIEMRRNGKDITVTIHNLEHYLRCLSHWLLVEGVGKQMEALREGFESVFPLSQLAVFYPEELELVLCGASEAGGDRADAERWDAQVLMEAWKPDHGYTVESKPFRYLAQVLSTYTRTEQRRFLQFVTGSPRLPVGGFKSLSPPLTVVRKTVETNQQPDDFLPSVMTCVNYLKLPDYSSIEILRDKLRVATQEGLNSFHLS